MALGKEGMKTHSQARLCAKAGGTERLVAFSHREMLAHSLRSGRSVDISAMWLSVHQP